MRVVGSLSELPPTEELAVIINCGTKWVTTLALAAATAHARAPILLIDCASRDGSREHFAALARRRGIAFDWLEWPLRVHGVALDQLFAEVRAQRVLLVDSDLEILTGDVIARMRAALAATPNAYGAGFLHAAEWMGPAHALHERAGFYAERMWIPCVMLRAADMRRAREAGCSFAARSTFHDFAGFPRLSRLAAQRYKLPILRKHALWRPRPHPDAALGAEGQYGPAFVAFDTGADVHAWQKSAGRHLATLPGELWGDLRHYHGVTRAAAAGRLVRATLRILQDRKGQIFTESQDVAGEVRHRLATIYGITDV